MTDKLEVTTDWGVTTLEVGHGHTNDAGDVVYITLDCSGNPPDANWLMQMLLTRHEAHQLAAALLRHEAAFTLAERDRVYGLPEGTST